MAACDGGERTGRLETNGPIRNEAPSRRKKMKGLTGCHGLISGPDLELVKVRSPVLTLLASDYADGMCVRVDR